MHRRSLSSTLCLSMIACSSTPRETAKVDPPSTALAPAVVSAAPRETTTPASTTSVVASATASAAPKPPPSPCPDGMVKVTGGAFDLGPLRRKATVADFCVEKTEVTASAYEACVKDGKCSDFMLKCAEAATYQVPGKESFPIVCVDFKQAKSYCEYKGMRLPTEEEWEWVARAGTEARKFAWGNEAPAGQACWSGSSEGPRKGPCAVGSFPAGNAANDVVDLTGNVFEWTDSKADAAGTMQVCKGGTWRDGVAAQLSVSRPGGFKPEYRCGFGGMRCVTAPKP